jgi:hypothetical protein
VLTREGESGGVGGRSEWFGVAEDKGGEEESSSGAGYSECMEKTSVPSVLGTVRSFLSPFLFAFPVPRVREMVLKGGTENVLVEVSSRYTASSSKYTDKSSCEDKDRDSGDQG